MAQAERISLRKLDSGKYYCEDLGIIVDKERIGGAFGPPRTEWGMTAGDCFVSAPTLGDCRGFLGAIYDRAAQKAARGRTKKQCKLTKIGVRAWLTDDGIEVTVEQRQHSGITVNQVFVELVPGDRSTRAVVGSHLDEAKRFIESIAWRGESDE